MLKVGLIGFGGGSALIPLVDDELVRRRRVLDPASFTRHTVVASITPGALPVKLGGLAGLQTSGAVLTVVLALAVALPGTALTLGLVAAVSAGGGTLVRYVELASVGITVFIIALLVHYVDKVVRADRRTIVPAVVITVIAFAATGAGDAITLVGRLFGDSWTVDVPRLTAVQLIGAALAIITVRALVRRQVPDAHPLETLAPTTEAGDTPDRRVLWATVLLAAIGGLGIVGAALADGARAVELVALVLASTLTSFGGGEAYVGVADGFFVAGGYVTAADFYTQLVPIANALPGPILIKLAAGVGYAATAGRAGAGAAWVVATCAAVVAVTSCTAVAVVVMSAYSRAQRSPLVRDIGRFILPVICGLLLTTSASMLLAAADVVDSTGRPPALALWVALGAIAAVATLRHRRAAHDVVLLLACGGASLIALGIG